MTETTQPTDTSLRVERTFDAPAEQVFDAWTNPEVLRRWWRADPTWSTPVAEVDLRVGGSYRISMLDPDGAVRLTVMGQYREVRRPERLVYSWQWEQEDGTPGHASLVTVGFHADGERTKVVLVHSGLESASSSERHTHGWNGVLDQLQGHLSENAAHAM
jgi:uncharacterized protein YndB with AHSA1/START domain